ALAPAAPKLINADDPSTPLFLTNERLTATPWAARHLVDITDYNYEIEGLKATSLIAQLGCPFNCGFCGGRDSPMLRRVRLRSSDSVVDELEHLHTTYGFRGFMFYDDELNVNKQLVETMRDISNLQSRLGVDFRFRGFIKSELFNDQQAAALYAAGFRWLLVGFESGSPRILDNINKRATRDDNSRCLEIAHDHGLKIKALMSVGHPGESLQTINDTRTWLLDSRPDDFDLTIITTYPGTPYFDQAEPHSQRERVWVYTCPRSGDRLYADEIDYLTISDYYKGDPNGGYRSYVYTDNLSREDLVNHRHAVETSVREKLNIPFPTSTAKLAYEHSMGQSGLLPPNILRRSQRQRVA
ncbi:MAG: radical SAM protein, partial [Planctomycetaceae bacterium]